MLPSNIDIKLNSVDEIINHLRGYNDSWIFRGQSDASWGLRTSLGRIIDKIMKNKKDSAQELIKIGLLPDAIISNFKEVAPLYGIEVEKMSTIWNDLALMQHYGIPTQLLDFTFAPFVALFFSIDEKYSAQNSSVFCFNYEKFNEINLRILKDEEMENPEEKSIEERYIYSNEHKIPMLHFDKASRGNLRGYNQQGVVATCTPAFLNIDDIVSDVYLSREKTAVEKIIYPSHLRNDLHKELAKMNLVGTSIYPDAKGVETAIRREALLG